MRVDVARLARRVLVVVVVSGFLGLAVTATSGSPSAADVAGRSSSSGFEGIRLKNVAGRVGLHFRQGAFRFGVSPDPAAMTGGGLCALDYNNDGWVDLFVVNSFTEGARAAGIRAYGWHAGAAVGDVNGDGRPDLYVAAYTDPNVPAPGSAAGFPNNVAGA